LTIEKECARVSSSGALKCDTFNNQKRWMWQSENMKTTFAKAKESESGTCNTKRTKKQHLWKWKKEKMIVAKVKLILIKINVHKSESW